MKKILLSVACAISCAVFASAADYTLVMGSQWGTEDADLVAWTQEGFTFTPAMGENAKSKVPVYKSKNQEVRFYALNTLTITAPVDGEPMTQLIFTLSKQGIEEQAVVNCTEGGMETQTIGNTTITWNGSAYSVTFTVGERNTLHTEDIVDGSGQFNFNKVQIATGNSTISKPEDTRDVVYMCNATATDGVLSQWTQVNLTFSALQGDDDTVNFPALKNDDEARLYAGNSITISTVDGQKIKELEFILSSQGLKQQAKLIPSTGEMEQTVGENALWAGDADSVTFEVSGNEFGSDDSKKGQFDFTQINIKYETTSVDGIDAVKSVVYYNLQGMRITNPREGEIYILREGNTTRKVVK